MSFICTSAIRHPWFARIGWQWLAELVERLQPGVHRLLEAVLREPPLDSEVGESGAVGRLVQDLLGLVEQRMQRRHVADQQRSIRRVELQLPGQREVIGPALLTEEVQTVSAVLEGQRERRLSPRLPRRAPQHLDEPDALVLVGQSTAADADVAGGLEQPVVPERDQPPTDPQVRLALGVIGQADPRRLGHPVVAEAVPGVAADRVGDPPATAVDGLEQAKFEGRPQAPGRPRRAAVRPPS